MPIEAVLPPPTPVTAPPAPVPASPAAAPEPAAPPAAAAAAAAPKRITAAERIGAIAAGKTDPGKEAAPSEIKPPAAAPTDPESDEAIKTEIETKTQKWEPGQKKAFTDLRYSERDARRKVKELEGRITEAEKKGKDTAALEAKLRDAEAKLAAPQTDPKEVDAYKEKLTAAEQKAAALEQELQVAAVERSDEWQSAITKPRKAIEESVKALAKKHDASERKLMSALYGTDEEQAEAVADFTGPEQTKFYNLALKMAETDERAEVLRTNAADANVKIAAKRQTESEQQVAARKTAFAAAHKTNWAELSEALPILNPVEGTDEVTTKWNDTLTGARKWSGETEFASLPPESQSSVLQRASVFPMLVGALQAKDAVIAERSAALAAAETELGKFRANKPGGEITPKEEGGKPQTVGLGAKGTASRIQAALGIGR